MTNYEADHEKATDLGIDARDIRALTEHMTVCGDIRDARGDENTFIVVSASGSEYVVDIRGDEPDERCTCPDAAHNLPDDGRRTCKHAAAALYTIGARPIPETVDLDDVSPQILAADHVDREPRFAAAIDEGPTPNADGEGGERAVATDGGSRMDECECEDLRSSAEVPCWYCYRTRHAAGGGDRG